MPYNYHILDVFTENAFGGNQLAVFPDARGITDEQMAAITREFNFSETIFVFPPKDPSNTRAVRIFTPGAELQFAGHPTIGVSHALAATGEIELTGDETRIVLEEGVGPVPVVIRSKNGKPFFAQLTTAVTPAKGPEVFDAQQVAAALSLSVDDLDLSDGLAIETWSVGLPFIFTPLKTVDALGRARPNVALFEQSLGHLTAPDVFLFVAADESSRDAVLAGNGVVRSRMFAPLMGIPEDPATGSANASLAGYLASRSSKKDGLLKWTSHQGVEMGRPSRLEIECDVVSGVVKAVRVGGSSVLVASGVMHVV
jgi:trans-2,3-dihydro-3-hydroxyanthranilate isomerase